MRRKESLGLFITKFVIFIILVSTFITLGTVTLHEFGHSIAARAYSCSSNGIILGMNPYLDVTCPHTANSFVLTISGLLITTLFSVLLFFVSKRIVRYFSVLIFSIGLITSAIDLNYMNAHTFFIVLVNLIGYLTFTGSIIGIVLYYCKEKLKNYFLL